MAQAGWGKGPGFFNRRTENGGPGGVGGARVWGREPVGQEIQEVRVQMPCADFVLLRTKPTENSNHKEIHTMTEFLIML